MFEHGLCVGQTGEAPSPKNPIGYLSGHGLCGVKNAQAASSAIPHVLDKKKVSPAVQKKLNWMKIQLLLRILTVSTYFVDCILFSSKLHF